MPRASSDACSMSAALRSSWRSMIQGARCTTVTSMPRAFSPLAASSPSRPAPITTAWPPRAQAAIIASVSAMSR